MQPIRLLLGTAGGRDPRDGPAHRHVQARDADGVDRALHREPARAPERRAAGTDSRPRPSRARDLLAPDSPVRRPRAAAVHSTPCANTDGHEQVTRGGFGSRTGGSVDIARIRAPAAYERAIDEITLCLAQQPLHRLQKLPGSSTSDPFLYDDSFLHDHVARSTLRAHGDTIGLKPGVAHGLARLAGC